MESWRLEIRIAASCGMEHEAAPRSADSMHIKGGLPVASAAPRNSAGIATGMAAQTAGDGLTAFPDLCAKLRP